MPSNSKKTESLPRCCCKPRKIGCEIGACFKSWLGCADDEGEGPWRNRKNYLVPLDFSRGSLRGLRLRVDAVAREQGTTDGSERCTRRIDVLRPAAEDSISTDCWSETPERTLKKWQSGKDVKADGMSIGFGARYRLCRNHRPPGQKAGRQDDCHGQPRRTGLQRLLLGSVAERTLRYADCPVLIVKK